MIFVIQGFSIPVKENRMQVKEVNFKLITTKNNNLKTYPKKKEQQGVEHIDTLEQAYEKIATGNWRSVRTYHSDIYYITHLVNYKFFPDEPEKHYTPQQIKQMLYEEGLLKWEDYGIPPRFIRKLQRIRFKHVPETRPDYNQ